MIFAVSYDKSKYNMHSWTCPPDARYTASNCASVRHVTHLYTRSWRLPPGLVTAHKANSPTFQGSRALSERALRSRHTVQYRVERSDWNVQWVSVSESRRRSDAQVFTYQWNDLIAILFKRSSVWGSLSFRGSGGRANGINLKTSAPAATSELERMLTAVSILELNN